MKAEAQYDSGSCDEGVASCSTWRTVLVATTFNTCIGAQKWQTVGTSWRPSNKVLTVNRLPSASCYTLYCSASSYANV